MTRVAILQSAYIPWKGYFDIIASVDTFVVYDDVQYRQNHWHNRNLIKTQHGPKWLTVPVLTKNRFEQTIEQTEISGAWAAKHWRAIRHNLAQAPFFSTFGAAVEQLYGAAESQTRLSEVNGLFLRGLCEMLGIETPFVRSSDLQAGGRSTERLLNICIELGATRYLTGPSARDYLEVEKFDAAGIAVEWMDYSGYPEYPQLHGPFAHNVTVLDLLFNTGQGARSYMKAAAA